jgi:putative ABC transport system permease protein
MFAYYLGLALRSCRANPVLTGLMVLALGLGIGACMTTLTVFHVLSADPLPGRSERLHMVQLDAGELQGWRAGEEPDEQLTRLDAETLLAEARAPRQALMSGGSAVVEDPGEQAEARRVSARYSSADFFAMMGAPLRFGSGWSADDDRAHARVVVLSHELNERLFGGVDSTGRSLRVQGSEMRVAGVLAPWRLTPHFYDLNMGSYARVEEIFLPFATAMELGMNRSGSMNCWGNAQINDPLAAGASCAWLQYWVELPDARARQDYRAYLVAYAERQRQAGRFERPPNERLRNVHEWLLHKQVVPGDVRLQLWLALGFLLVCLTNTVGLLLAKCLRGTPQIGVRRALGASRKAIFAQHLVEALLIGGAGGLLGLLLAWIGLLGVRMNPADYAELARLDLPMLAACIGVSLLASLAAGLLPAWRAAQVAPALQLKSQ